MLQQTFQTRTNGVIDITADSDDLLDIILQQVKNANMQQNVPDFVTGLNRLNSLIIKKKGITDTTFAPDMW